MTPHEFIQKWKTHALTERAAAQEHFIDLCRLFNHPTPAEADPAGDHFTFEKGAAIVGGGDGWADVWKKGYFAWEYKKRKRNLEDAMAQLTRYAASLESPPLLVVCDTIRFQIKTTWTNLETKTYSFELEDLADPEKFNILRAVFHDPEALKPARTRAKITAEAADKFQAISDALQSRNPDREAVAHFVNQLVFCFFASSVKLLPEGLLKKLLLTAERRPHKSKDYFDKLFEQMEKGGEFDLTEIAWFNGGLFDGRRALILEHVEIGLLIAATSLDWSLIDPTIFGTLFERFLDPDKRAQIGAHYTDPDKIMLIVEPVVLRPLRRDWEETRAKIEKIMAPAGEAGPSGRKGEREHGKRIAAARAKAQELRDDFVERLAKLRILDPACGSGNFLYLALQGVKDIEYRAINECEALGLDRPPPRVGPEILRGIEINPFAAELARTTIWIGDIQWSIRNGIFSRPEPYLRKLDSIEQRDAVLRETPSPRSRGEGGRRPDEGRGDVADAPTHAPAPHPNPLPARGEREYAEAPWPEADFIIGNPPFLGDRKMIAGLGEGYVESLRAAYADRIPGRSDLVCYWIVKGADAVATRSSVRCGLVATNSISGGNNLPTLLYATSKAKIFEAWSDEPWVIDGAAVRVSIICFSSLDSTERCRLNGKHVEEISARLTAETQSHQPHRLIENESVSFIGTQKNGPFDISGTVAREFIAAPLNVNGRPNSDVVRPWTNGSGMVRRDEDRWIIDFGPTMSEQDAAFYEGPFQHVATYVKPTRVGLRRGWHRTKWWLHGDPRPALRRAILELGRFIATPRVSKYRLFVWAHRSICLDSAAVAIARDDDTTFGILHSRFHEAWSLRLGTWLGVGNDPRYTPTTTFETFPFPEGLTPNIPARDYESDPRARRIAQAARELDEARRNWLNPPDLVEIVPEVVPFYPDRILPKDAKAAATLKERTLTNLYNQRPQWLVNAHDKLDRAVASAYGWPEDISTEDALAKLLELNLHRAGAGVPPP